MPPILTYVARWLLDLLPRKLFWLFFFWRQPPSLGLEEDWSPDVGHATYDPVIEHTVIDGEDRPIYKVKLLQYNTQQLVHFADVTKIRAIAKNLCKGEYDVIILNEMFNERSREILVKELRGAAIYTSAVSRAGREKWFGLGEDSGLFMCSRFPIHGAAFFTYETQPVVADVLANKGFLIFSLVMPDGTKIGFGATHTQAQVEGSTARLSQIKECMEIFQLGDTVHRLMGHVKPPLVFCGDLNVTDVSGAESAGMENPYTSTREFPDIVNAIKTKFPGAVDCFRLHHPDPELEPGYTFDAIENSYSVFDANRDKMRKLEMPPEQERLDHVWMLRPLGSICELVCTKCEVDRQQDLSDHWGVCTHFELRPISKSQGDHYKTKGPQTLVEAEMEERAQRFICHDVPGSFYSKGPAATSSLKAD